MPKVCEVCGRGPDFGHRVSFSGKRNPVKRSPNLQRVHVIYQGQRRRMWVCTRCLKAGKVRKV